MADWFAHRLDAEEIARNRISSTGRLYVLRPARGGFLVIETQKPAPRKPIKEINLYAEKVASAPAPKKVLVGTIDVTPTWAATLPTLLLLLESESPEGQKLARDELAKMAKLADAQVAAQRAAAA